jgi:glutamate-5-semialdehyde dehydrogenase
MDLNAYARGLGKRARGASRALMLLSERERTGAIGSFAAALRGHCHAILGANARDVETATGTGVAPPLVERLRLNEKKVEAIALAMEQIARQPDPVGQTIAAHVREDGLRIERRRVPIGVVLFFYESRPNVTADAAALCLRSGNAVILRGGKEAAHSNAAIAAALRDALTGTSIPTDAVQLVESTDRALVPLLLKMDREIDLVIPRGGESLIRAVVSESTIPVLKHFTGNCHIYVDDAIEGMEEKVVEVCVNAKTGYPLGAVCNAVEHILFSRNAATKLLVKVSEALAQKGVEVRGDNATRALFPRAIPMTDQDWSTEYLAPIVGIKVVEGLDEAIDHINAFGSHHTDAILSTDHAACEKFVAAVDSASVMVNASTRFADGGEYGLGAEIGISTDKLHARGPMGAADLTTYKWVVTGDGHVRG